jgi:putative cardiolipin synthase
MTESLAAHRPSRLAARPLLLLFAMVASLLAGCASVLPQVERQPSTAIVAPSSSPLMAAARKANIAPGMSGVWPLMQAGFALDARLSMIEHATTSLDLQYYLIGDDSTGRPILRALRDAANRGVRVRLLIDDLYTIDMDRLLVGLAATPNIEVRLFNPFVTDRRSSTRRLIALARDFKRLNHRMHNKLFIADGAMAIIGGRNLADEYFLRGTQGNFIDFDLMTIGSVVPALSSWFDLYWNSPQVYPATAIALASGREPVSDAEARQTFDDATKDDPMPDPPMNPDYFGAFTFSSAFPKGNLQFIEAEASAFADSPSKIDPANNSISIDDTLTHRFLLELSDAQQQVTLFSPYFIPGKDALSRIRRLRKDGVAVRVITNSLAVSDEPLVSIGLERHQTDLLKMGVDLYELSSNRLKLDHTLKGLLGTSTGRLHAKLGFIDHNIVLVGSMNIDPRSSSINTEIGVRVVSPQLNDMVLAAFKVDSLAGVYQVVRGPNGGIHWVAVDGDNKEDLDTDPDTSFWLRARLLILSLFVPEGEL